MTTASEKMKVATMRMLREDPFFAHIILRQSIVENTDISTMSTNGTRLQYNPEFVNELSEDKLAVVLTHESMHVACGHPVRMAEAARRFKVSKETANIAADLCVNSMLRDRASLPRCGCVPGRHPFETMPTGKTLEEYTKLLIEKGMAEPEAGDSSDSSESSQNDSPQQPRGSGQQTTSSDSEASSTSLEKDMAKAAAEMGIVEEAEDEMQEQEMLTSVASAAMLAESCGNLPGFVKELVSEILQPKQIPWEKALRSFLTQSIKRGNTYRRPHRRSGWRQDIILPSHQSKGLGHVVFGVDTSGSMSKESMNKALSEIQAIASLYKDSKVTVVQFDTQVKSTQEFTRKDFPIDTSNWTWAGRGGTAFQPFFDAAEKLNPAVIVLLTDGYAPMPRKPTKPTIWLMVSGKEIPKQMGVALSLK